MEKNVNKPLSTIPYTLIFLRRIQLQARLQGRHQVGLQGGPQGVLQGVLHGVFRWTQEEVILDRNGKGQLKLK